MCLQFSDMREKITNAFENQLNSILISILYKKNWLKKVKPNKVAAVNWDSLMPVTYLQLAILSIADYNKMYVNISVYFLALSWDYYSIQL